MRLTRVLSVALHNPSTVTDPTERVRTNLDNVLLLCDRADAYDPDFVCFPETCLHYACKEMLTDVAQAIPGPATDAVGEKARELGSYVVLGLYERDGESFYNTAVLVGPDGEVRGRYRKVAPTEAEIDAGIMPGDTIPVWDTEFGRVGVCICWDARYSEVGTRLRAKRANLVFHPTLGSSHHRLLTWARYNGYHVVACDKNAAKVYTPRRTVVGGVGDEWKHPEVEGIDLHGGHAWLSFAEVNTDCKTYSMASDGVWRWPNAVRESHAGSVELDFVTEDGVVVVESIDEDLSIEDLESEFEMATTREYEERTRTRIHDRIERSPLLDVE